MRLEERIAEVTLRLLAHLERARLHSHVRIHVQDRFCRRRGLGVSSK
jgi:hypothetical protein